MSGPKKEYLVPSKDYALQYEPLMEEILAAFARVIREEDPILGESTARFEEEFAAYCGVTEAVGTGSGTDALVVALRALDVGPGDEVITASNTFVGTVSAILLAGATPVLVEPDPETMNIDWSRVTNAITPRTKVLMPVHLYGRLAIDDGLFAEMEKRGITIVEDAAQAHGAQARDGRRAGAIGRVGCFSFHPSKLLGAFGDGGMITTSDRRIAERARCIRHLGKKTKYETSELGPNTKLDTLQAALLRIKLRRLDGWIAIHGKIAARYAERLAGIEGLRLPAPVADLSHVHHLYVVRSHERDRLRAHLRERGINAGVHYPVPPHLQSLGPNWNGRSGDHPIAEALANEVLSLPISHELDESGIDRVVSAVREFYER